ncbi:hypothetical protein BrevBR_06775 [Brevundimonas sp. BR2-1]|uniref:hypothetical protein n=1 Tax=unclassified Brevundimonas TaxID=2622653 RepID=UPI002FC5C8B5
MRTAALIAAAAAALTLSACNRPAGDATDAATEAAEASGAAVDTAATADGSTAGGASARSTGGSGSGSTSTPGGQTMAPSGGATVNDGAMAPNAQPPAGEGTTITETERRLNPPQNNQPVQ